MILRRFPDSRFSEVLPGWTGETVAIFGGGPSLTLEQVETVRLAHHAGRCRVIAVNDSYLLAPWADALYAADPRWWGWHKDRTELSAFAGDRCSIQNGSIQAPESVHVLRNRDHPYHGNGLSLDPQAVTTGRNGGWQALNLAILAGAKTVILLGIDGQKALDGRTHWHGGHPQPEPDAVFQEYRAAFSACEAAVKSAGVRVLNASPGSAIGFERMGLAEALRL